MHLLIAAAGSGSRMGSERNKLLLPVAGSSLLQWTLQAALAAESIDWIGIIGQQVDKDSIMKIVHSFPETACSINWINGGSTRQESVEKGLASLPIKAKYVLIHDGARCLVKPYLFDQCAEAVAQGEAVIAATKVVDTIKKVDQKLFVQETLKRDELWAAQTPQGFEVSKLLEGHAKAKSLGWSVTDDASLFERLGWSVKVLDAGPSNIKVTTPFDLIIAESVLSKY